MNQQKKRWKFECVVQNMRRASRLISRRYEEALRPVNLTSSQFSILQSLTGRRGLPLGLMVEILGFEQTTLTRLLKPLEKRELIELHKNPDDRRQKIVSITQTGESLFQEAKTYWQSANDASLERMTEEEWQLMRRILYRLSD